MAFYGETGNADPTFQEIELTLGTPLNGENEIKYGVNDTGITFYESKAWDYAGVQNDYSTVMNGDKGHVNPYLQYQYVTETTAVFWTYSGSASAFALGKLCGTNTDSTTFGDASLIANYELVCDLTKQTA